MSRKFSLAYLTIPGICPQDQIRIAAEAGYDFVSLRTIPMYLPGEPEYLMDRDPQLFKETKAALEHYNMKLMDIELARVREDLDIADFEKAFEKGKELGATDVLSSIWSKDKPFYIERMGQICEMAKKYDLMVNLEFVTFAGVTNLAEAKEVQDALRANGISNLKIMVDTLHAHRSFVKPEEISALAKAEPDRFGFIHLCDGPKAVPAMDDPEMLGVARGARLYTGEGGADIAGMLKELKTNPISIELPNFEQMKAHGADGHARRCLETAKQYFAEHDLL